MSIEYPCVYFDNGACRKDPPEGGYIDPCVMGPCSYETPSNGDRVRDMCDGDLAKFFAKKVMDQVALIQLCDGRPMIGGTQLAAMKEAYALTFFSWLRSPAEEGNYG